MLDTTFGKVYYCFLKGKRNQSNEKFNQNMMITSGGDFLANEFLKSISLKIDY